MEEYKKYLADQILSEEKIVSCNARSEVWIDTNASQVTYRSLSRALKTHVNTAKGSVIPTTIIVGK